MSITGMSQSVLDFYSFNSTQSSRKQTSTEQQTPPESTGDTVSLSAQSVSLTVSSELGDYDLTSITPGNARRFASTLWKSGIISTDEFQTILVIATKNQCPYAPGVEGPANNSPFNLMEQINQVANGTHKQLSAPNHQWLAFDGRETCTSLLDILTDFENDTTTRIELNYSSISLSVTA